MKALLKWNVFSLVAVGLVNFFVQWSLFHSGVELWEDPWTILPVHFNWRILSMLLHFFNVLILYSISPALWPWPSLLISLHPLQLTGVTAEAQLPVLLITAFSLSVVYLVVRKNARWLVPILLLNLAGIVVHALLTRSTDWFWILRFDPKATGYWLLPGFSLLVALLANRFLNRRMAGGLLLFVGVLFGWQTWAQLQNFRTDETFFAAWLKDAPENVEALVGLATVKCEETSEVRTGMDLAEKALVLDAGNISALAAMASCFYEAEDYAAIFDLDNRLEGWDLDKLKATEPGPFAHFLSLVGLSLIETEQYEDGISYLCEALDVDPENPAHKEYLDDTVADLHARGIEANCDSFLDLNRDREDL